MRKLRAVVFRFLGLFRKAQSERDVADELESHLSLHIEDNQRRGMDKDEARRAALITLGGLEQTKALYRERRSLPVVETLLQDIRYTLRALRKSPGFTSIAVITLALGIGANTAIFNMVNALMLRPYNFPELDRLVRVWENRGIDEGWDARWIAPQDAEDLRTGTQVFEGFTTYQQKSLNLTVGSGVQPVPGCLVSANFFDVLQMNPAVGRTFTAEEEQPGADGVAIVSHGIWRRQFGGDPALLGKTIRVNQRSFMIVGIMPPGFSYPVPAELWIPLALTPEEKTDRSQFSVEALARLRDGVSLSQARAALESTAQRFQTEYPVTNAGRNATALELRKELYLYTLPMFGLLQIAAAFVLLLACANLANLLFARVIGRQKEIAVRTALGADRLRLARLFVTEMVVLSTMAGALAIAVSLWSVKLLRTSISEDWTRWVPGWNGIRVDRTVLAFAIGLVALVGIASGIATALHAGHVDPYATLKETGRAPTLGGRGRLRSALVVAQVMLALILLVCAGITTQGFTRLANVYLGFEPANVLRVEVSLPEKSYAENTRIAGFYERLLRGTYALPSARSVALVTNSPASNVDNETTFFTIQGRPALKPSETSSADLQISSPAYFDLLRIPLVAGREYSDADGANGARVAVISKSMATRFWPNANPLGQQIKLGAADPRDPWITVLGIVEDVRQNWWNPTERPTIYLPFVQAPRSGMVFLLRAASGPANQVSAVREVVRQIDADVALRGIGTLDAEISDSIAIVRIMGILMGIFGGVALALSSVGVYGVLAESVERRTAEIGIRLALGAAPRDVIKLVLGRAMKLTALGLAIGFPASLAISRTMESLIFGVVRVNISLVLAFAALLTLVALLAAYVPARRAMRVDPMTALRYE